MKTKCFKCGKELDKKDAKMGLNRGDGSGPIYYCECLLDVEAVALLKDFDRHVMRREKETQS